MLRRSIEASTVAGGRVLDTDFSEKAVRQRRRRALELVVTLCRKYHPYTDYFKSGVQRPRKSSVLTDAGLLNSRSIPRRYGGSG
jgi:hypothetical protein